MILCKDCSADIFSDPHRCTNKRGEILRHAHASNSFQCLCLMSAEMATQMRRHETNVDMNIDSCISVEPRRKNIRSLRLICLLTLQLKLSQSSSSQDEPQTHTSVA